MGKPASNKRIVGMVLFASCAFMVLAAILIGTGVVPIAESIRQLLVAVLAVVAVVDAFIGWRFLMASSE